jgi:hypothetical protein
MALGASRLLLALGMVLAAPVEAAAPVPVPVKTARAQLAADAGQIIVSGTITYKREQVLSFKTGGVVHRYAVDAGDTVKMPAREGARRDHGERKDLSRAFRQRSSRDALSRVGLHCQWPTVNGQLSTSSPMPSLSESSGSGGVLTEVDVEVLIIVLVVAAPPPPEEEDAVEVVVEAGCAVVVDETSEVVVLISICAAVITTRSGSLCFSPSLTIS